jgi:hypothetical protein
MMDRFEEYSWGYHGYNVYVYREGELMAIRNRSNGGDIWGFNGNVRGYNDGVPGRWLS